MWISILHLNWPSQVYIKTVCKLNSKTLQLFILARPHCKWTRWFYYTNDDNTERWTSKSRHMSRWCLLYNCHKHVTSRHVMVMSSLQEFCSKQVISRDIFFTQITNKFHVVTMPYWSHSYKSWCKYTRGGLNKAHLSHEKVRIIYTTITYYYNQYTIYKCKLL